MSSKVIIPVVIAISVLVTAGIMYTILDEPQPQIVQSPPEIIYVDKTVSEFFEGTNEIKKISSQEELKSILEASSSISGNFYGGNSLVRDMAVSEEMMFDSASDGDVPTSAKVESGGSD